MQYCPHCGESVPGGEGDIATCAFGHTLDRSALLSEAEVFARWCSDAA